jgi:hypothetical protein
VRPLPGWRLASPRPTLTSLHASEAPNSLAIQYLATSRNILQHPASPTMSSITERRLPPSQVDCKWWMQGYCRRGKSCHFKHDEAMAGVQNMDQQRGQRATPTPTLESSSSTPSQETCAICFGSPDTYGLLVNCDHAFCLGMSATFNESMI